MRRVDYINQEPVMCFPTPILNFDIIKQNKIEFSKGDFVYFNNKSRVPTSTFFYKYKEFLLILDIDRENPIAHIIRNSKVRETLELKELTKEHLRDLEQVIDIHGKQIKIRSFSEIEVFYNDFIKYKNSRNDLHKNTRLKLQELIESSDKMKKLDKVAGTKKVIDFIDKENFNRVKSSLAFIYDNREMCLDEYKQSLQNINNINVFVVITNTLEKEFYEDFRTKNKEHANLLTKANIEADALTNKFNDKWFVKDLYTKEKELGALYDCYNEMYCDQKKYNNGEVEFTERLIAKKLIEDCDLLDSFLEWVELCPIDTEEVREIFEEILEKWESNLEIIEQDINKKDTTMEI